MKTLLRTPLLFSLASVLAGCASVQTGIEIAAPAAAVRAALYDFDQYPSWNPFIVKVDGKVSVGSKVEVTVQPVGKEQISGATRVLQTDDNHLVWRGSLRVPGLFSGRHEFVIEALGPDRTLFRQNEKMGGLAVLFLDTGPTEQGFKAMNEALKQRAEAAKQ